MRVGILGASGLVGRKMLRLLETCPWVEGDPLLLTSARSAGSELVFSGRTLACQEVNSSSFDNLDIVLFSAGGGTSLKWAPVAEKAGCVVIDNSSAWRMTAEVPLVVPEINPQRILLKPGIIANPNCSTIQIVMAAAPLDQAFGLRECHVTTLQAVSGAGQEAVQELLEQTRIYPKHEQKDSAYPRMMAFNALPAIGKQTEDGGYEEETKVLHEMRRIMDRQQDLHITCTATRVPVLHGHSAALRLVFDQPVSAQDAISVLEKTSGVKVVANPHDYHTAREIAGKNDVFVGRVRPDTGNPKALLMWVVADNLLKGAAWNAIQIANVLAEKNKK